MAATFEGLRSCCSVRESWNTSTTLTYNYVPTCRLLLTNCYQIQAAVIICYWGEKTCGRFRNNFRVSLETSSLRHHRTFNLNLFIPLQQRRSHRHGCISGGEEEKTTDHPTAGYPAASLFPACLSADLSLRLNVSFVFYRDRKCEDDQTLLHVRPLDLISAICNEPQCHIFS